MAMIGKVLRMHHRENKSVREIARATSLSRNTVRKYLRVPVAQPPKYVRRAASTKLTPFVEMVKTGEEVEYALVDPQLRQREWHA